MENAQKHHSSGEIKMLVHPLAIGLSLDRKEPKIWSAVRSLDSFSPLLRTSSTYSVHFACPEVGHRLLATGASMARSDPFL